MNTPLHPIMAQALRGFIPPAHPAKPDGLPNKQTTVPSGLYEYQYQDGDGLVLDCHLEYEKAFDGGTGPNSEESYPESILLVYALCNGVDISNVLSEYVQTQIEEEALCSMEMDKWGSDYDKGEERAMNREFA